MLQRKQLRTTQDEVKKRTEKKRKDVCGYNCNECEHYSRDCLLPKRTRKEQRSQGFKEKFKRIFWMIMKENNWKPKDFAAEESKEERSVSVSSSIHVERMFWKVMKENNWKP